METYALIQHVIGIFHSLADATTPTETTFKKKHTFLVKKSHKRTQTIFTLISTVKFPPQKLQEKAEVKRKMEKWGMTFDPKLLEVQGRTLPVEKITMQGGDLQPYKASDAEW